MCGTHECTKEITFMYPTTVLFSYIMSNTVSKETTGPRLNTWCFNLVDFTGTFFLVFILFLYCPWRSHPSGFSLGWLGDTRSYSRQRLIVNNTSDRRWLWRYSVPPPHRYPVIWFYQAPLARLQGTLRNNNKKSKMGSCAEQLKCVCCPWPAGLHLTSPWSAVRNTQMNIINVMVCSQQRWASVSRFLWLVINGGEN